MLDLPAARPAGGVVDHLRRCGVTADHRGQTLRLSPGIITTEAGCDRLSDTLAEIVTQA
jgi:selenocysteine lyase/cysteine desulfurase